MEWQSLNTLREKYLAFFESKGHLRLPSFPLVPQGDGSLLLINAGMAPMKKYFTGEEEPPRRRVTTCQKCVRTLDIDNVGKTARHGTYFEMLGNFSFGDYFKSDAIPSFFIRPYMRKTTRRTRSGATRSASTSLTSSVSDAMITSGIYPAARAAPALKYISTCGAMKNARLSTGWNWSTKATRK